MKKISKRRVFVCSSCGKELQANRKPEVCSKCGKRGTYA